MHQHGYFDDFEAAVGVQESEVPRLEKALQDIDNFSAAALERAVEINKTARQRHDDLGKRLEVLVADRLALARCLGFWAWIHAKCS